MAEADEGLIQVVTSNTRDKGIAFEETCFSFVFSSVNAGGAFMIPRMAPC